MARNAADLRRGDRVELTAVPAGSDYEKYGIGAGSRGAVDFIDSQQTVHVQWDSGRRLGVLAEHLGVLRAVSSAS